FDEIAVELVAVSSGEVEVDAPADPVAEIRDPRLELLHVLTLRHCFNGVRPVELRLVEREAEHVPGQVGFWVRKKSGPAVKDSLGSLTAVLERIRSVPAGQFQQAGWGIACSQSFLLHIFEREVFRADVTKHARVPDFMRWHDYALSRSWGPPV